MADDAADILVVDASAAVEVLVGGPQAEQLGSRLRNSVMAAPAHVDAEVLSALARLFRAGSLSTEDVDDALDDLRVAPITRYPVAPIMYEAWDLRENVAMRDALYVCLTRHVDGALVTLDDRLRRACKTHQLCRVA